MKPKELTIAVVFMFIVLMTYGLMSIRADGKQSNRIDHIYSRLDHHIRDQAVSEYQEAHKPKFERMDKASLIYVDGLSLNTDNTVLEVRTDYNEETGECNYSYLMVGKDFRGSPYVKESRLTPYIEPIQRYGLTYEPIRGLYCISKMLDEEDISLIYELGKKYNVTVTLKDN